MSFKISSNSNNLIWFTVLQECKTFSLKLLIVFTLSKSTEKFDLLENDFLLSGKKSFLTTKNSTLNKQKCKKLFYICFSGWTGLQHNDSSCYLRGGTALNDFHSACLASHVERKSHEVCGRKERVKSFENKFKNKSFISCHTRSNAKTEYQTLLVSFIIEIYVWFTFSVDKNLNWM